MAIFPPPIFAMAGFLPNKGILESIRIEPRLPAFGESFSINLTGSWPGTNPDGLCYAALEADQVVVHSGNSVQVISNLQHDPAYCDQPPAQWNLDVPLPASAWDAVNEEGFLLIEHLLFSGINMLTGIDQVFRYASLELTKCRRSLALDSGSVLPSRSKEL